MAGSPGNKALELIRRNIKEGRERAGLTQEQLAQKVHITASQISKIETGKSYGDLGTIMAIAAVLYPDPLEVFRDETDIDERLKQRCRLIEELPEDKQEEILQIIESALRLAQKPD